MKSKCSFILKASTALVLALLMLFGTVMTSLAAVVDELTDTGAEADVADEGTAVEVADEGVEADLAGTGDSGFTSGTTVYLNSTGGDNWSVDSSKGVAAYFYNSNSDKAWTTIKSHGTDIAFTVPGTNKTYAHVIFARANSNRSSTGTGDWFKCNWGQTKDLDYQSDKNKYKAYYDGGNDAWEASVKSSSATLTATPASITTAQTSTLAPGISGNTTLNEYQSVSYSIFPSSGASISGNTFTPTSTGTYTVTATVTYNAKGFPDATATATKTATITVTAASNPAASSVSLTQSAATGYTNETEITYTATATGAKSGVTYNFKVDGASVQNTSSNTYKTTYTSSGSKSVTVSVEKSGYDTVTSSAVTTTISDRPAVYLLGLKNEYNWTVQDSNKMTYNATTGLYEITRNLYQGSTTYGGTDQANANDTGFKVYTGSTYYGSSAGYTINGMSYNNTTLASGNTKNVCLTTKDLSSASSSAVPYKFTYSTVTKKVTVYYPMKVTYNMQSHGTNPSANGYVVAYDSTITAPTDPTATGYTFGGWYKEAACTNAWNFSTDKVTADTTLYAKWTAESKTLTVQAKSRETSSDSSYSTAYTAGTNSLQIAGVTQTTESVDVGSTVTVTAPATDPSGYTFAGWYEGTTKKSDNRSFSYTMPTSAATLTARYDHKYTLTISSAHGTVTSSPVTVYYNDTPANFTVSVASGWKYNASGSNAPALEKYYTAPASGGGSKTFTGKTVSASDKVNATLTLDYTQIMMPVVVGAYSTDDIQTTDFTPISGSDPTLSVTLTDGKTAWSNSAVTVTKNAATPSGYQFVGWYVSDNESTAPASIDKDYNSLSSYSSAPSTTTTFTPNGTEGTNTYRVYALYSKIKFTLIGTMQDSNQWTVNDDTYKMTGPDANGKYTVTVPFTANEQSVQFKIVRNNTYTSTVHTSNYGSVTVAESGKTYNMTAGSGSSNCGITVTYSGDYVFTFDPAGNNNGGTLVVTYPTRNVTWQTACPNGTAPAASYISSTAYGSGDTWNLVATDNYEYEFTGWTYTVGGVANGSGVTIADASAKSTTAVVTTTSAVVITANYSKVGDRSVTLNAKGTSNGSTYGDTLATSGLTYKIGSGSATAYSGTAVSVTNGSKFEVTAPATITSGSDTYVFVDWHDGSNTVSTNTTYTISNLTADKNLTARYKKQLYITLYNSYEYKNDKWVFVAAPPKKVEIYADSSATTALRTYTYSSGTAEQRGEENIVSTTGTYYEGNKLLVYPGEKIVLNYAGLASSDFIKGAFYNNSLRYTVETEGDNYYVNRSHANQTGTQDSDGNYEHGDDDFGSEYSPYTFSTDTTLYAYSSYYTNYYGEDKSNTIIANNPAYAASINQNNHTVTINSASGDYLNVDIELSNKYQIHINGDNWDGLKIENMNDEGYYYENEPFNAAFKISLDNTTDTTATYSWNALGAEVSMNPDHPDPPSGLAVTAKKSDGSDASTVGEISYFLVSGNMTSSDLYIKLPLVKTYKMRLANIVVADAAQHRTMITEGSSGSDTTNYVGNITAIPKKGETTGSDISSDGTYYTWNDQDGNSAHTHNRPEYVRAFTDSDSNKKLNGGVNRDGSNVEDGYSVTYTYTPTASFGVNYSFVGWFEGKFDGTDKFTVDYSKKLSGKTSFTYTPTKNTVIIAVATRDLYLGGNFTSAGAHNETSNTWASGRIMMQFDPTYDKGDGDATHKGRYYYTFDTVSANTEYKFRAYDTISGTDSTGLTVWNTWSGNSYGEDNDDILFAREKYNGGSVGGFMYKTNTTSATIANNTKTSTKNHQSLGYAAPVTVYFYAYDGGISVKSTYQWSRAYVSEGRGIDATAVKEGDSNSDNTTFNTPTATVNNKTVNNQDVVVTTEDSKYGNGGKYEKIYECLVKEKDGQIVVNAKPNDANLELDAFLVYNIETKVSEAVKTFTTSGSGADITYTGNITIPNNSKIYVVPIYKFTQAYITAKNLETHMVYVRAAEIDKDDWGGLVSMYSWGTDARYDSGRWPGQLMVPSDDGKSFYAPLTFMKNGLAGVTFNNYAQVWSKNYINFVGTYKAQGVSDVDYSSYTGSSTHYIHQVFDYREPISIIDNINEKNPSIYDSEDMDMVFALKPGNKTSDTVGNGAYNASFNYEYLSDSSGKYRVDLNGNKISTNPTATYYVVCNYTENYKTGGSESYDFKEGTRDGTTTHNQYSIDWNVYDINGAKIAGGTKLSATYTDVYKSEMLTDIAKLLIDHDYPVSGKAVKIAYENPKISSSNNTEAVRYSGQWYADGINTLIEGNVRVGIYSDGAWLPSDSNAPGYATATVSIADADSTIGEGTSTETGCSGASHAKVTKTHATNGKVSFTVNTTNNFLGWYRDNGEGGFEPVGSNYKNQTITPTFNSDITYYAFYSASASYRVKYKDRFGNDKYFTAKGSDLTEDELADNGTLNATSRADDISTKLAKAVTDIGVFNRDYTLTLSNPTSTAYTLTYNAEQTDAEYTLTAYYYDSSGSLSQSGSIKGGFNTVIDLTKSEIGGAGNTLVENKPTSNNKYFVGWKRYNGSSFVGDEILSTQANFGYGLTEDLTIAPVFSDTKPSSEGTWTGYVDKNVVTQELTDADTGTIYNDSIISFRNSANTGTQFSGETGVVILMQANTATATQKSNFTGLTDDKMLTYLNAIKGLTGNKTSAKMNSTKFGEAYALYIPTEELSRLNRVDIFQHLDYAKYSGGNYKVAAYYESGGSYVISQNVVKNTYTPHDFSRITSSN